MVIKKQNFYDSSILVKLTKHVNYELKLHLIIIMDIKHCVKKVGWINLSQNRSSNGLFWISRYQNSKQFLEKLGNYKFLMQHFVP
jgi:hypothetical protein